MPITIPADARVIGESRLSFIAVCRALADRAKSRIDEVKSRLKKEETTHAQSDLALAALRPGGPISAIDPVALHKLVLGKKITIKEFLGCVTVRKEPLAEFLSEREIEAISKTTGQREPSLTIELKPGVTLNEDDLDRIVEAMVQKQMRGLKAGVIASLGRGKWMRQPKIGDQVGYVTGLSFEGIHVIRCGTVKAIRCAGLIDLSIELLEAVEVSRDPKAKRPHSWHWPRLAPSRRRGEV